MADNESTDELADIDASKPTNVKEIDGFSVKKSTRKTVYIEYEEATFELLDDQFVLPNEPDTNEQDDLVVCRNIASKEVKVLKAAECTIKYLA